MTKILKQQLCLWLRLTTSERIQSKCKKRVEGENDIQGEIWLTPGPGFQESSPSRITQDLTPHVMATCEKCYLPGTHVGDSKSQVFIEAWSLRYLLPSTHKFPDPQKNQSMHTNGFTQLNSLCHNLGVSCLMYGSVEQPCSQVGGWDHTCKQAFTGCTVSSHLCSHSAWPYRPVADHPVLSPQCVQSFRETFSIFF